MSNLKYKLEALLFSSAREMKIEELANLTKSSPEEVREALKQLKEDYEKRDSSIILIDYEDSFKLNVKSEHAPLTHQIVTETELSKTLMETLAVIAFKYPIKQSDLIKIRTNKAYDHLNHLEEMGYITRQKYGRTKLIKLTPKFFEYFDLPEDKLKRKFEGFEGITKAIKEKEEEIKKMKEEMKRKAEEAGKKEKEGEPEIDLLDEKGHKQKLEVYEETEEELKQQEAKEIKPYEEKLGDLEVTDVSEKEEEPEEITEEIEGRVEVAEETGEDVIEKIKEEIEVETAEEEKEEIEEETEPSYEEEKEEKIEEIEEEKESEEAIEELEEEKQKKSEEIEDKVDKRVEELLHPEEETEESAEEEQEKEESIEETEEEPKDLLETAAEEEENKLKRTQKIIGKSTLRD